LHGVLALLVLSLSCSPLVSFIFSSSLFHLSDFSSSSNGRVKVKSTTYKDILSQQLIRHTVLVNNVIVKRSSTQHGSREETQDTVMFCPLSAFLQVTHARDGEGGEGGRTRREDKEGGQGGRTRREDKEGGQGGRRRREDKEGGQGRRTRKEYHLVQCSLTRLGKRPRVCGREWRLRVPRH
jgi:hypothetical protein